MKKLIPFVFAVVSICCSTEETKTTNFPIVQSPEEESSSPDSSNNGNSNTNDEESEGNVPLNGESRILFVGNSLTYFNDLPGLVEEEAAKRGVQVTADMLAYPNYAIIDHWNDGEVQELVKDGGYDFLVIQQGPSSQAWGRQVLFEYGEKFNTLCNTYGIQLAYFMVWPSRTYYDTFPGVIKNYKEAAMSTNSILCPVGESWKRHFDRTGDFSFYGTDGFHPSLKGSTSAARIIVNRLFQRPKG